jgi:hypothetical protein
MKTTLFLLALIFSLQASALHDNPSKKAHPNKYCAQMKDGQLAVMHEGKTLDTDAKLANGTTIKADGSVMRKDGTRIELKEGQCIDKDGKIMMEEPKDKTLYKEK